MGDALIDRMGGEKRKSSGGEQAAGTALAIVLGIVLDGIPESAVIGLGLLGGEGVSAAVIAAVFLSNLPGGDRGHHRALQRGLAPHGASSASGPSSCWCPRSRRSPATRSSTAPRPRTLAFVLAFAGGAILTMLADTMMPEAFQRGGKLVGLATTLGFVVAFAISSLE